MSEEMEGGFTPLKKPEPAPPGDIVRGLVTFRDAILTFEISSINGETYDIEARRILMDARQFTDWIWQLHDKKWMTAQHYSDLLDCLSAVIYRHYGVWPQVHYMVEQANGE